MRPNKALLTYDAEAVEASLAPLTRRALHELGAEGITPTIAEVCWLNRFALQLQGKFEVDVARGHPVQIGGRWFWRHTRGSAAWLVWMLNRCGDDDGVATCAVCYSLEHARDAMSFEKLYDEQEALKRMAFYQRGLTLSPEEVQLVLRLMGDSDGSAPEESASNASGTDAEIDSICGMLSHHFGGTPEYWRWGEDQEAASDYMQLMNDQIAAGSGRHTSGLTPSEQQAERRYDYAVQCLRLKHLGAEKAGYGELFKHG